MPQVHNRKARKDYPDAGVKRGEMYYTARLKTGPRSSKVIRQATPILPSQLTTSAYLASVYGLQETFMPTCASDVTYIAEELRTIGTEAQERFDAIPGSLQESDNAQMLQTRAESCESIADELDELATEWDDLAEPDEPDEGDFGTNHLEEYHIALDEYETKLQEFSDRDEAIPNEAAEKLGEVET